MWCRLDCHDADAVVRIPSPRPHNYEYRYSCRFLQTYRYLRTAVMKPSPVVVSQALKTLKPHTPMIRFRKGTTDAAGGHHPASAPSSPAVGAMAARFPSPSQPSRPLKQNEAIQLPIIEDWQLPLRFRRRPLDADEIAFINRGGPEK